VKKIAWAGFFLLLLVLGIAYNSAHHSASSGVDAAVPGQGAQTGDPGATSASWVTVRDTREKAFSIQVPQGWKTYGGLSSMAFKATVDTTTGQRCIAPLGQGGNQWINGNNVVVESGLSPGAGFKPLTPVSRKKSAPRPCPSDSLRQRAVPSPAIVWLPDEVA
jgi:hypothetical protein